jgi:acetyltransferase-like isoleucine patch superfamily enzyme
MGQNNDMVTDMKFTNYRTEWEKPQFKNQFAKNAIVLKNSEIKNSKLGVYTRVKSNIELRNSVVGDYTIMSSFSIINACDIGKFCCIGPGNFLGLWEHNMWVTTHTFPLTEVSGEFVKGFKDFEKDHIRVAIGNDVWTGAGAIIRKGVTVGDGAIIGAGALVTRDVPPYAIVIGQPARVLRFRFSPEEIKYLLKIKWWDFDRKLIQEMTDAQVWDSVEKVRKFLKKKKIGPAK